jgi:hypothetical protein
VFATEHTGVVLPQSALATHWTHAPLGAQTGCDGVRAAHPPDPGGAIPQGTQTPWVEQEGLVASWQSEGTMHSTHAPDCPQTGLAVSPGATLLRAHATGDVGAIAHGTHVPWAEQKDAVAWWQSASAAHSTHAPVTPQTGLAGSVGLAALLRVHALVPAAAIVHGTHVPIAEQNGVVA